MTSRLYYQGGLSGKYNIQPDLMTMGKYLGGGMSFGLFGGKRDIMQLFDPRSGGPAPALSKINLDKRHGNTMCDGKANLSSRISDNGAVANFVIGRTVMLTHSGTFNNNVMSMAAGIAASNILIPSVPDRTNALGDSMRVQITKLLFDYGVIPASHAPLSDDPDIDTVPRGMMWISGIGSINTIHFGFHDNRGDLRQLFYFHMLENGIYLAERGFIVLNITHTEADVTEFVEVIEKSVDKWKTVLQQ